MVTSMGQLLHLLASQQNLLGGSLILGVIYQRAAVDRVDESSVEAHFTSNGHTEANLSVMIIDKCWKDDKESR